MIRKIWRVVKWILLALLLLFVVQLVRHWDTVQRVFLGGLHVHETTPPALPANLGRPAILVFSKTNAFRHEEAIPAARALFDELAKEKGWSVFHTENGAAFQPDILARFDAVVFSNTSGDVFSPEQQAAFKGFVENGGGYLGIHAAGDSSHKEWVWYRDHIIGADFTGHPMSPQFQQARVTIEDHDHPATKAAKPDWRRTDEWYSFAKSPRADPGVTILATLDETTYSPKGPFGSDLAMGKDHPIIWARCTGKGRVLYSALGHTAQAYAEPEYRQVLTGALNWVLKLDGKGCEGQ